MTGVGSTHKHMHAHLQRAVCIDNTKWAEHFQDCVAYCARVHVCTFAKHGHNLHVSTFHSWPQCMFGMSFNFQNIIFSVDVVDFERYAQRHFENTCFFNVAFLLTRVFFNVAFLRKRVFSMSPFWEHVFFQRRLVFSMSPCFFNVAFWRRLG